MNFSKFVKRLGADGVINEASDGTRWLASDTVYMKIPDGVQAVTGKSIVKMPRTIDKMITSIGMTVEAGLTSAVMPVPDGKIADCIRIFTAPSAGLSCPITNDDWSLLQKKSDAVEIQMKHDLLEDKYVTAALLVKQYPVLPTSQDMELVGVIFPIEM